MVSNSIWPPSLTPLSWPVCSTASNLWARWALSHAASRSGPLLPSAPSLPGPPQRCTRVPHPPWHPLCTRCTCPSPHLLACPHPSRCWACHPTAGQASSRRRPTPTCPRVTALGRFRTQAWPRAPLSPAKSSRPTPALAQLRLLGTWRPGSHRVRFKGRCHRRPCRATAILACRCQRTGERVGRGCGACRQLRCGHVS